MPCEIYCHSLTDPSILGPGLEAHTLTLFALHTPARLFERDRAARTDEALAATLRSLDSVLAEPIEDCLLRAPDGSLCLEAKTPLDLDDELALPRGNIFHRDLAWPFAEHDGEAGGWGTETAIANVQLGGAGARRGGGVSGIPGRNAAMAVLRGEQARTSGARPFPEPVRAGMIGVMPLDHTRGDILVVDDEPTIAEVVSRYLERAGYATRVAGDGRRALELHGERAADLIVLDLMLPGVDGLEVMRRMRNGHTRRPAFILLTAKGEESDRIVGLRLGADDYVVKPFSPAELVARVDSVLRRVDPEPEHEPPLEFGRLRIEPAARRVLDRRRRVRADRARVRAAAVPRPPPRPGVQPPRADGPRLGLLLLHGHLDRHGPHPPAAREDRERSGRAAPHRDGVGDRLPVRAVRTGAVAARRRGARRGAGGVAGVRLPRRVADVRAAGAARVRDGCWRPGSCCAAAAACAGRRCCSARSPPLSCWPRSACSSR